MICLREMVHRIRAGTGLASIRAAMVRPLAATLLALVLIAAPAPTVPAAGVSTPRAMAAAVSAQGWPTEVGELAEADVPEGWEHFSSHGFGGAVRAGWRVIAVDGAELRESGALTDPVFVDRIPPPLRRALAGANLDGTLLYVMLDDDGTENINVTPACADGVTRPVTAEEYARALASRQVAVEKVGTADYHGVQLEVIRASVVEGLDTYQTFVGKGTCSRTVTLTMRAGADAPLDDFARFISLLRLP